MTTEHATIEVWPRLQRVRKTSWHCCGRTTQHSSFLPQSLPARAVLGVGKDPPVTPCPFISISGQIALKSHVQVLSKGPTSATSWSRWIEALGHANNGRLLCFSVFYWLINLKIWGNCMSFTTALTLLWWEHDIWGCTHYWRFCFCLCLEIQVLEDLLSKDPHQRYITLFEL